MTEIKEISTEQGFEKSKKNILFIDVREDEEVLQVAYDVPNIMHIPLSQIRERMLEIPKNQEIVIVCRSGGRSMQATTFLAEKGYDAINLQGGIIAWQQQGFPTK